MAEAGDLQHTPDVSGLTPETKQYAKDRANFFLELLMGSNPETGKLNTNHIDAQKAAYMLEALAVAIVPGQAAVPMESHTEQADKSGYFVGSFIAAAQERLTKDTGVALRRDLRNNRL